MTVLYDIKQKWVGKSLEVNIASLEEFLGRKKEDGKGSFAVEKNRKIYIYILCVEGMYASHLLMEYFVKFCGGKIDKDLLKHYFRRDATPDTWHIHPVCKFILEDEFPCTVIWRDAST